MPDAQHANAFHSARFSWQSQSNLASDHTKESVAEAETGTASAADAVQLLKTAGTQDVVTVVAAGNDTAANATAVLIEADHLILPPDKLQGAVLKTLPQVNQTGMLSEAASTPDLTVGM